MFLQLVDGTATGVRPVVGVVVTPSVPEGLSYTDAFCGETINPARDEVLRVVVSRMGGGDARQGFYVHRHCFVQALVDEIPLGEVFDD